MAFRPASLPGSLAGCSGITGCMAVQEPIPGRRARVVRLAAPSRSWVEGMSTGLGLSREAPGHGGGGVVEILNKGDYEDHGQALLPDGGNDPDLGVRDGGPEIGGRPGAGRGDRSVA